MHSDDSDSLSGSAFTLAPKLVPGNGKLISVVTSLLRCYCSILFLFCSVYIGCLLFIHPSWSIDSLFQLCYVDEVAKNASRNKVVITITAMMILITIAKKRVLGWL